MARKDSSPLERVLRNTFIRDAIETHTLNIAGRIAPKSESENVKEVLRRIAEQVATLFLESHPQVSTSREGWKQQLGNQVGEDISHRLEALVAQAAAASSAINASEKSQLAIYGISEKAALVATMIANGLDPKLLLITDKEMEEYHLKLMELIRMEGKPAVFCSEVMDPTDAGHQIMTMLTNHMRREAIRESFRAPKSKRRRSPGGRKEEDDQK